MNIGQGDQNTAVGFEALKTNNSVSNTAVGYKALSNSTTSANTAVGSLALSQNTGGLNNVAVGSQALTLNTTGSLNVAMGNNALSANEDGDQNISFGVSALLKNKSGSYNIGIGTFALFENVTGNDNVAIGQSALSNNTAHGNTAIGASSAFANTIGTQNVSCGLESLKGNTLGSQNVVLGYQALSQGTALSNNVVIGFQAGFNATGGGNIFIGHQAGYNETGGHHLYLDNSSTSTPLIYGDFIADSIRINGAMDVVQDFNIVYGSKMTIGANNVDGMTILNDSDWMHGAGQQNFGNGGNPFTISSAENKFETAGIYGDGDCLTLWSTGDGAPGQPNAYLYILDEDKFDGVDSDPYNNAGLKAYVSDVGIWTVSDRRKKENIHPFSDGLSKIDVLPVYTYNYLQTDEEQLKSNNRPEVIGVMAQDLAKSIPQAVQQNDAGDHFVNYNQVVPVLITAIQEQQKIIAELEQRIAKLEGN